MTTCRARWAPSSPHGTLKVKTRLHRPRQDHVRAGRGRGFKADVEKKGVKVVGFEGTEEKSNFDPIITPIKAKNPDLIYFGGIYDQGAPVLQAGPREGREVEVPGPRRHGLLRPRRRSAARPWSACTTRPAAAPASSCRRPSSSREEYKKKFSKNPEPYAAEAYDATAIALKALEAAAKGGKAPTREAVTAAIRKVKYTGITGAIEFDDKGDPKKASYFVLQVASDNPEKWGDNKEVKRLAIAAPRRQEVAQADGAPGGVADARPAPAVVLPRAMDFELLVGIFPQVLLDGSSSASCTR